MEWPISPPRRLASLLGKWIYAEPPPLCTQRVRGGHFQNLSCQGWGGGQSQDSTIQTWDYFSLLLAPPYSAGPRWVLASF